MVFCLECLRCYAYLNFHEPCIEQKQSKHKINFKTQTSQLSLLYTLESGINVRVRLLIFEKIWRIFFKNDRNALIDVKMN